MSNYMSLLLAVLLSTSPFFYPSHAMEGREDSLFEKSMSLGREAQVVLKEMHELEQQSGSGHNLLEYVEKQKEQFRLLISKVPQDQRKELREKMENIFGDIHMNAGVLALKLDPTERFYRLLDNIFAPQKTTPQRRGGFLPTPPIKKEPELVTPSTQAPPLPPRNTTALPLPPLPLRPIHVEHTPDVPTTGIKLADQFKMTPQGAIMDDKDQGRIMSRRSALEDSMMTESMLGESQFGALPQPKEPTLEENIQKLEAEIDNLKTKQTLEKDQVKRGQLSQVIAAKLRTINDYKSDLARRANLSKAQGLSTEDEKTHQQRALRLEEEAKALNALEQSQLRPEEEWED